MNSRKLGINTSDVEVTNVSQHGIWMLCCDRELFLSFEDFPWFKDAPVAHVLNVEEPSPNHYHWPELDIDLGLKTIEHPQQYPMLAQGLPTSWAALHQDSERLASEAQAALLQGRRAAEQRQPMEVAEARAEYTVAKDACGKKDGEDAP